MPNSGPYIPPILCSVFACLFGRGIGSIVVLLYTPFTRFSKGSSSFVSLNVYMPCDPLKGDAVKHREGFSVIGGEWLFSLSSVGFGVLCIWMVLI